MKVHIIGMGALGLLYGYQLYQNIGSDSVSFIMDDSRFEKHSGKTFYVNGQAIPFQLIKANNASPADLVIVAVKGPGLSSALNSLQSCIGPDTIIISLLNGITSEQLIAEKFGSDKVIHCVAQGTDAAFFDRRLTFVQNGQLRIGTPCKELLPKLEKLADFLTKVKINYVIEEDIIRRIWSKFMLNVGLNQTCFVFDTNYGGVLQQDSLPKAIMVAAMREVLPIAAAENIVLTQQDVLDYLQMLATLDASSMPSMAQDRINKKKSEVDLFAGTIINLGAKHGIPTPVNDWLYAQVKQIEDTY